MLYPLELRAEHNFQETDGIVGFVTGDAMIWRRGWRPVCQRPLLFSFGKKRFQTDS